MKPWRAAASGLKVRSKVYCAFFIPRNLLFPFIWRPTRDTKKLHIPAALSKINTNTEDRNVCVMYGKYVLAAHTHRHTRTHTHTHARQAYKYFIKYVLCPIYDVFVTLYSHKYGEEKHFDDASVGGQQIFGQ